MRHWTGLLVLVLLILVLSEVEGRKKGKKGKKGKGKRKDVFKISADDSATCLARCGADDMKKDAGVKKCLALWTETNSCYIIIKKKKKDFTKPSDLSECSSCSAAGNKRKKGKKGRKGRKGKKNKSSHSEDPF